MFELSAQYGGKDCFNIISPYFRKLKVAMKIYKHKSYCEDIDAFSFILRVDGNIQTFNFLGSDALELNTRKRYIKVDIGLSTEIWKDKSEAQILDSIRIFLLEGLEEMILALGQHNYQLKADELRVDFNSLLGQAC